MGTRDSYAVGTFSWVDLATTNTAESKAFYAGLFGWHLEDTDAGGGAVYTMCRIGGDAVCGLYETPGGTSSVPPGWMSHVTVADAQAVAARASELGGVVVGEVIDVGDAGRMAMVEDPQGAVVAVWQPGSRMGAERVNDVGCLCMNELATTDLEAASAFYERLFGWTIEVSDGALEGPHMILNRGAINASVFAVPADSPSHWRPCFTVESIEDALRRVHELGGEQLRDPVDIGHGTIAMVRDSQGVPFTMFAGETDP